MKNDGNNKREILIQQEELLLKGIKTGDHAAFKILYDKYFKILYTYAIYLVNNQLIAEDVVEEVFVKIWETHQTLVINTSLKAYLFQMTRNSCLDQIKYRNIRQSYKKEVQDRCKIEESLDDDPLGPASQMMTEELTKMIKSEINKFPTKIKRIFKMSRYYQIKNKDIAIKENISESTVEKSIRKVLDHLTKKLLGFLLAAEFFIIVFEESVTALWY